ncbi:acyl-CoA dehydrogenase family protein [Sneathiella aquimaris]|uniref:acyl-CoA dehydrogenase family protein n=1 Tax=Sneathiella aquimaris TaxID=2599305 RepID=UPI00146A6D7C|nr:acyl-CoA dehydrogenase family protein [Sneathiella aquimaris]
MELLERAHNPNFTPEHLAFRETLRRFVETEIEPFASQWDEEETFPRALYKKAADIGLLGIGYPEEFGGIDADIYYLLAGAEELGRAGAGGVTASLLSHTIGAPPIKNVGNQQQKEKYLPRILSGEWISALAITEPSGGSDVANLQTTARKDGDHYIVNGSKTFITSGMRADIYTVAVRTGGPGMGGISLLLIDRDTPGFSRTPLKKMGWWASDTATLYFDNCKVPAENLLGTENAGFQAIMLNFNYERLWLAAGCISAARACFNEVAAYAQERIVFGKPLSEKQVVRHKLVQMAQAVNASQAYLDQVAWRVEHGEQPIADICMLKNQATETMEFCAREGVQTMGGAGYLRGPKVERIYRDVRVNAIGGGAEEIMRDLASRQLGI